MCVCVRACVESVIKMSPTASTSPVNVSNSVSRECNTPTDLWIEILQQIQEYDIEFTGLVDAVRDILITDSTHARTASTGPVNVK